MSFGMAGIGGRPVRSGGDWEEVAVVFDLTGSEEISVASFSGFEDGYDYRLVFDRVFTTAASYNAYYTIWFKYTGFEAKNSDLGYQHNMSQDLLIYSRANLRLYGIVDLIGPGRYSEDFFALPQIGPDGPNPQTTVYSNVPASSSRTTQFGPSRIGGFELISFSGSFLLGRCAVQRKKFK